VRGGGGRSRGGVGQRARWSSSAGSARTASSTAMEERRRRHYGESRESVTAAEKRLTWGFRWAGL